MLNSHNSQQKPFWKAADPSVGLNQRIAQINKYRDPTTSADEIMRWCKRLILPALLLYSGILGAASYYSFFSHNFSPEIAIIVAVLLAGVIEFGKSRMGLRAIQKPFLEGWKNIVTNEGHGIIWGGMLLFAIVTFTMSVINSTEGGRLLSVKSGQEKHATTFSPTTEAIDAQIAAAEKRMADNQKNTWKGKVTVYAQQANKTEAKTLASLHAQREQSISTQRADFERQRSINDQNTETSSNMLMAAGGWVEAIQLIVLFIIAACQSVLAGKMAAQGQTDDRSIGFKRSPYVTAETPTGPTSEMDSPARRYIGFNRDHATGDVHRATVNPTVAGLPQYISDRSAEAILKYHQRQLGKEPPNFKNPEADKNTVAQRIVTKLNTAEQDIFKMQAVDQAAAQRFMSYLDTKIRPALQEEGFEYKGFADIHQMLIDRSAQRRGGGHDA
jgi:hypothetical protein